MSARTCTIGDCGMKHLARGMCSSHYWRWRHGVPMDQPSGVRRVAPPPRLCDADGCGRRHHSRGLCQLHARREVAAAKRVARAAERAADAARLVAERSAAAVRLCPRGCGRLWHDLPAVASPIPELPWPECPGSTITVSDSERVSA